MQRRVANKNEQKTMQQTCCAGAGQSITKTHCGAGLAVFKDARAPTAVIAGRRRRQTPQEQKQETRSAMFASKELCVRVRSPLSLMLLLQNHPIFAKFAWRGSTLTVNRQVTRLPRKIISTDPESVDGLVSDAVIPSSLR